MNAEKMVTVAEAVRLVLIFVAVSVASLYLHEVVHWLVYKVSGVPAWISLQRVRTLETPSNLVWAVALIAAPVFSLLLGIGAYRLNVAHPGSILLFSVAFSNLSSRIVPNLFALHRLLQNRSGFSDEGNFAVALFPSQGVRILFVTVVVVLSIVLACRSLKYFPFPRWRYIGGVMLLFLGIGIPMVLGMLDDYYFP